jgi:hypothetical protein
MESLVSNSANTIEEEESEISTNNLSIHNTNNNSTNNAPQGGSQSNRSSSGLGSSVMSGGASNLRRRRHLSPTNLRAKFIGEIEEIRINPVISRKGYLNFLEEKSIGWSKRFVTIRRPYVFVYNNEKDLLERSIFNLSTAQIVYNEEEIEMLQVGFYLFAIKSIRID